MVRMEMDFGEKVKMFIFKVGGPENAAKLLDCSIPNLKRWAFLDVIPPAAKIIERFIDEHLKKMESK
jgi:hypothetical protein